MEQTMNQEAGGMAVVGAKKQKGMIIGMVALAILACGGISFGIFGMSEANKKASEISDLKVQIEDRDGKISTLETDEIKVSDDSQTITISDSNVKKQNPVIVSNTSLVYELGVKSVGYPVGNDNTRYRVDLNIRNGEIASCRIYYDLDNRFYKDCDGVNGISGKIYKAVSGVGEYQDGNSSNVVFIMENGTVEYIPVENLVTDMVNSGVANVKGTLAIDGFVVDVLNVAAGAEGSPVGWHNTTFFVLSDGSYVKYDESMLK